MAEQNGIVADPISSDGSEESWILLDEMDEAMNEEFNMSPTETSDVQSADDSADQSTSTDTLTQSNLIEVAKEVIPTVVTDVIVDDASHLELISSEFFQSNDDDDDDEDEDEVLADTAHLRSVLEKSNILQAYDDLNDGSTTDGSISILGDHEINQGRLEADDLTTHTPSPQPLQMWMRCTPIDMTISTKRPLESRSRESNRYQKPTTADELDSPQQNLADDILHYLERLNNFLSSIYLLQVFLLFLTAASVAILAIIYSRYSACKLEMKDLEQKLYSEKMEKYEITEDLKECEILYELEVGRTISRNVGFKLDENRVVDRNMPMPTDGTRCLRRDSMGVCKKSISIFNLDELYEADVDQHEDIHHSKYTVKQIEEMEARKQRQKSANDILPELDDESSLSSKYDSEFDEELKNRDHDEVKVKAPEVVQTIDYLYKRNLDALENSRQALRDLNADTPTLFEPLGDDNSRDKTINDHTKDRRDHSKLEKTNGNRDKIQHFDHSMITVDKFDESASDKHFDRKDKKEYRDKKHYKEKNGDKENKRKHDHKDTKKYQADKDQGKWNNNKNERKKYIRVYEPVHDD